MEARRFAKIGTSVFYVPALCLFLCLLCVLFCRLLPRYSGTVYNYEYYYSYSPLIIILIDNSNTIVVVLVVVTTTSAYKYILPVSAVLRMLKNLRFVSNR